MAVLSDNDRAACHAEMMSTLSSRHDTLGALTKAELRDAVNAVDLWVDTNAAAYNLALPLPARVALTASQKAELLLFVVRRRWEVG